MDNKCYYNFYYFLLFYFYIDYKALFFWKGKEKWDSYNNKNNYQRINSSISDDEIYKLEIFIKLLSEYNKSTKVGIIVSKNIEQALHPKNSIKLRNTKFSINNEILYSSTRKYNLDKETFSIIFDKALS